MVGRTRVFLGYSWEGSTAFKYLAASGVINLYMCVASSEPGANIMILMRGCPSVRAHLPILTIFHYDPKDSHPDAHYKLMQCTSHAVFERSSAH
jgi:hypothetical protein